MLGFTQQSLKEIIRNSIANPVNTEILGVSALNFKWIHEWTEKYGMSEKDFFSNIDDAPGLDDLVRNYYFTNDDFTQMLDNVDCFLKQTFPDEYEIFGTKMFERIGRETGSGFGDFALNIMFVYYIKSGCDVPAVQNDLNMAILRQFNDKGLDFAFPTQTLYNIQQS